MQNTTRLFIAEKPSMAAELSKSLPGPRTKQNGYYETAGGNVTWLIGHVLQQAEPDDYDEKYKKWNTEHLPIIPTDWKLLVSPSVKEQFKKVKDLIKKSEEIIHAGDPDREGQLLVDEVLDFVGISKKTKVRRILLNALDPISIQRSLEDLRDNNEFQNLKNSALARQRADWLIGMNGTRAFTLSAQKAGYTGVMNVGRVKSVTQALVVNREREIALFVPKNYYGLQSDLQHRNGALTATWIPKKNQAGLDEDGKLIDKSEIEQIQRKFTSSTEKTAKVTKYLIEKKKEFPKLPYSLSALQIAASKKHGMSPQQVLDATQKLYDNKFLSYPRSSSDYLPDTQLADVPDILCAIAAAGNNFAAWIAKTDGSLKSKAWLPGNDNKIIPHHAIIPTRLTPDLSKLPEDQQNIYYLVALNYVIQFYPAHEYNQTTIELTYENELLRATGKTTIKAGWRELFGKEEPSEEDEENRSLPPMAEGDPAAHIKSAVITKTTKPPQRFTTGTIIKAMKEIHNYVVDPELKKQLKDCEGIGTEATRAHIIDELFKGEFFKEVKKSIVPTDKCIVLVDMLPRQLKIADTTAQWEYWLSKISTGEMKIDSFMSSLVTDVRTLVETAKGTAVKPLSTAGGSQHNCPLCNKPLKAKTSKNGPFWGCTGYPECKYTANDKKGKPDLAEKPKAELSQFKCLKCGKALVARIGKKGRFWGCSGYPECSETYQDKDREPDFDSKKK